MNISGYIFWVLSCFDSKLLKIIISHLLKSVNWRPDLNSHQMYSKMLRQFSKGSLISISSESSKIHFLIKVLHSHIWINLCRRYFLFQALNVSLCYHSSSATLVWVLRSLDMKYFNFANVSVRGHSHIKLPTISMKMMLSSRPTLLVHFTSKCKICQK